MRPDECSVDATKKFSPLKYSFAHTYANALALKRGFSVGSTVPFPDCKTKVAVPVYLIFLIALVFEREY